ncbi:tRNA lysidine(34) synthetase TilS [Pseudoxanthomonas suwonensis]|uniref:tRNA(Ile)-lysidine synthase n=1 Tax=Pseudoxanthomonas suwonensis TaxID=314722 RepID=A0A0E3Z024_9GAMM|nr:tRNA lysidine(34) synthetase TilS [Pseudoxanthomonas suwonensis]AKC85919.1 tRNA(Ile)-lysidine synthetase [Pseudoxanthomonas suwonensis]
MAACPPIHLPDLPDEVAGGALVVAYSGGLDSTVLLHGLAARPDLHARGLRAVHVHHGLQAQADAWAAHCRRQAAELGIAFETLRVNIARDAGQGLEAAAREARYAALSAVLAPGDVLVTAHHLDDQAETFLLRALRASGPEGLGSMRPLRPLGQAWQWRPLLSQPREALLAHAQAHGLSWIEDPSNALPDPDRNFLRLQVLPLLRTRWPHASTSLARSAALCAQTDALLAQEDKALLRIHTGDDARTLRVPALKALPAERRARLLRHWIRALDLPPLPARGVERIEHILLGAREDARATFAWAGARVLRWRDFLHADRVREPLPAQWSAQWDGHQPLPLPDGGQLLLRDGEGGATTGFDAPLRVHARQGGERIVLPGRAHSRPLKHLLQERGVPPWRRAHLPLLSDATGRLLAAGDVVWGDGLAQWLHARGWHLAWHPPAEKGSAEKGSGSFSACGK